MSETTREAAAGPVLEIRFQGFWIDCSECGDCVGDPREMTGERDVGESGIAGWRPLCRRCARKLGLED